MRLIVTDMKREEFERLGMRLDGILRHAFFEGGRDMPMDPTSRAAVLREGAPGLKVSPSAGGIWRRIDPGMLEQDLARTHRHGSWPPSIFGNSVIMSRAAAGPVTMRSSQVSAAAITLWSCNMSRSASTAARAGIGG